MATTKKQQPKEVKKFESEMGKRNLISTSIYTSNARTVISINDKLDDETNLELQYVIDAHLKSKGY